jgi:hypothetical protein
MSKRKSITSRTRFENENLATACADCNLGKSNVPLSSVSQPIKDGLKIERERMHQMALYNKWLLEIREARQMDFMQVSNALMEAAGENPQESRIAGNWATSVRCLLKRLSYVEIVEAVWIANDKFSFQHERYKTFKYFCGICWRKVSANEGTN